MGVKTGVSVGVVCGLVFALAYTAVAPTTMAYTATATTTATTGMTAPMHAMRAAPQVQYAMQEPQAAYYEDAAPLDPLYMESAPAAGPNFTVAGLLLAAAASLALLARKALNQEPVSNGLYPADMSMATVMAAPAKKSKFSRRREALEPVVEGKKLYPVAEALQLVKETSTAKFTESVDVAVLLGVDPR
jgi:hypothetical protein